MPPPPPATSPARKRVVLLGATGTIGRAVSSTLVAQGYDVVALVRGKSKAASGMPAIQVRVCDVSDPVSFANDGIRGEHFDALISCIASRTGHPKDAWAIDHDANVVALDAAKKSGIPRFILLSAICVQKPRLAFQEAKLAFEAELAGSGLAYSIVRPTAFFKSLSGQLERVRAGKPFLVFGDGTITACKPISDRDLAAFIVRCLEDRTLENRILPIGGPGPAITPLDQAHALFRLLGKPPNIKHVPVALLDIIIGALSVGGHLFPQLGAKAELAKIGRYYATESMLVLDPATGRYEAAATPETGNDTLFEFYAELIRGNATIDRGEHAVF